MQYAVIVFFSGLIGSFCLILSDWCSSCVRWLRFCSIISLCRHLRGCSWKLFIFTVCKQKRETSTMEPWDSTMLLAGESLLSLLVCKYTISHTHTHTHTHARMHARTHAHNHCALWHVFVLQGWQSVWIQKGMATQISAGFPCTISSCGALQDRLASSSWYCALQCVCVVCTI